MIEKKEKTFTEGVENAKVNAEKEEFGFNPFLKM